MAELDERMRILVTPSKTWFNDNALKYDALATRLLDRPLQDEERRAAKTSLYSRVEARFKAEARENMTGDLAQKQRLLSESNSRCNTCGLPLSIKAVRVDHVLPLAEGGFNEANNLQALCEECNQGKSDYFEDSAIGAARPWSERRSDLITGAITLTKRKRFCALLRADKKCERCGVRASESALTVIQRVSVADGGQPVYDNLIVVCTQCG